MKIAIIGTGNVGSALARGWVGKGHPVTLGTRNAEGAAALAVETGAAVSSPDRAAAGADVVILALPWGAAEPAVKALGDLAGKVVIDCMNPLGMVNGKLDLVLGHSTSGGEIVADWLPGARVVKTLNQVGAEIMAKAYAMPHKPVMFMAGEDEAAKTTVATLLSDLGFQPLDAGGIDRARILEPFAMTWINQAFLKGKGRAWAFAAIDLPQ